MASAQRGTKLIEDVLQGKALALRSILEQILHEISERLALSHALARLLDEQHTPVKEDLLALQTWPLIWDRGLDHRRQTLEHRLDRLDEERRRDRLQQWQDVAILRREFREWLKQYWDLTHRLQFLTRAGQTSPSRRYEPPRS